MSRQTCEVRLEIFMSWRNSPLSINESSGFFEFTISLDLISLSASKMLWYWSFVRITTSIIFLCFLFMAANDGGGKKSFGLKMVRADHFILKVNIDKGFEF